MGVKIMNKQEVGNQLVPPYQAPINIVIWALFFILMIIFWAVFILVLLKISYNPPPESSKEIVSLLCNSLQFLAHSTTGVVIGYPLGSVTAPIKVSIKQGR